jgi:hypothetical protein
MLNEVKKFLSRWVPLRNVLAVVVFEASPMKGQYEKSLLQWRVKRRSDGQLTISLKIIPDYGGGPDGAVRQYIDFKPEQVKQISDGLSQCLVECERLGGAVIAAGQTR